MKNQYLPCLLLQLLLVTGQTAFAQAPTITALSPARNGRNAPATTNVAITFSTPISSGTPTLGAVRVFSQQRGGLLRNGPGGSTSASGNTLTFDPTTDFRPGETILTTVTAQVQSSEGPSLARGQVHQFTVGVGGTGGGNFTPHPTNPNPAVGLAPEDVVLGDVDGDGDLDLLTANANSNNVSVRLNDGSGTFTAHPTNPNPAVGSAPRSIAIGDVDGDGDLDLLTANANSDNVSVRLNDGAGTFSGSTDVGVGSFPYSVVLGDVDGDGDLDLLTANFLSNNVSVRLNDGSGKFTPPATNPNPGVGSFPRSVAVGDVDGDGDLDLLTANNGSSTVSVQLNDGAGHFTAHPTNPNPAVGVGTLSVALGDVDGDGDLDLLTANANSNNVSVRLNDGSGTFTAHPTNPNPGVGEVPQSVVLGDVDGDGDLDLLTANGNSDNVSVRLNDGSGNFTAPAHPTDPNPGVGSAPYSVALGDVDGDGDLDLLTANLLSENVSVLLNQVKAVNAAPVATATANQTATVGVAFAYTVNAFSDANSPHSLTYSASISPANGLRFDPATRIVSGSPTSPGVSTVTVTATDPDGLSAHTEFSITTRCADFTASINPSPATLSCANPTVSLTASGGQSYRWEDNSTSALRIVSTGGTYSVTVTAAYGCTATAQITVTGNAADGLTTYYADADGDGFGNPNSTTLVCSSAPPAGYVTTSTDCDDTRKLYADGDGDGFGAGPAVACGVTNNTDCNDAQTLYADADGDGFGSTTKVACNGVTTNTDCNDSDARVHTPQTYYADADGDGFGNPNSLTSVCASTSPAGYVTDKSDCDDTKRLYADGDRDGFGAGPAVACGVTTNTDCNDSDARVHTPQTYYADADGDGFGNPNSLTSVCASTPPTGYVTNATDCDDTKRLYADGDRDGFGAGPAVACGVATNTDCNDSDATVSSPQTYYADKDGDGFGDIHTTTSVCSSTPPAGYVTDKSDCDDTRKLYVDGDKDGFGAGPAVACGVATNTDCDDTKAAITPTALTNQPKSLALEEKQEATFSVTATGTNLTYQWYFNGTTPANELKKETSATLSLKNVKPGDAGTYYVRVTGTCGSVLSGSATLTVSSKKSRLAAVEPASLGVKVLGNPLVGTQLEVEVTGAEGLPLQLQIIDPGGRVITQQHLEQAGVVEHRRLEVGAQPAGLLLLRVSTPTRSQVVKVVKQ